MNRLTQQMEIKTGLSFWGMKGLLKSLNKMIYSFTSQMDFMGYTSSFSTNSSPPLLKR